MSYNIQKESILHLALHMRGGKVHGSLARAGKVRAQTPKVDKQEKRKKKRALLSHHCRAIHHIQLLLF